MNVDKDKDVVAVLVVEGIFDTMELMVVIIQIPRKGKPHATIKSGIIPRGNKKIGSINKIHLQDL